MYFSEIYVSNAILKSESSSKFAALSELCILMSQQWIGHSVTMSWYDELWLHEGLNLFLQTMCVNEVSILTITGICYGPNEITPPTKINIFRFFGKWNTLTQRVMS